MKNFRNIHIGTLIRQRVSECGIDIFHICNFLKCTKEEVEQMYHSESLDTEVLLRWSKLLEYDFFRIYNQHLILYAPQSINYNSLTKQKKSSLPQFRKNIYTQEIIDFIIEQIKSGKMTKHQVISQYKIPKTTLYKWISKYDTFVN